MARRRRRRSGFAGSPEQHRADASSHAKEARAFAQKARKAARRDDCRSALHLFGVAAFHAGLAAGNRKWVGGKRGSYYSGGSRMGSLTHGLQKTIFNACKVR